MKLVETDAERPEDDVEPAPHPTPPRPERRRAYASLLLTLLVLGGTIGTIFTVFPPVRSAVAVAAAEHRADVAPWPLQAPRADALALWAEGALRSTVPLPEAPGLTALAARRVRVLERDGVLVRYRLAAGGEVTLLVVRAGRGVAGSGGPRGDELAVTWRRGPWQLVAVGPAAAADAWRPLLGAP